MKSRNAHETTPSKIAKYQEEARDRFIPTRAAMNFDLSLFELQRAQNTILISTNSPNC